MGGDGALQDREVPLLTWPSLLKSPLMAFGFVITAKSRASPFTTAQATLLARSTP